MTESEEKQEVLFIAALFLFPISVHPVKVKAGYSGYFLTKKKIREITNNLNVRKFFESQKRSFDELPEKYQKRILKVVEDIEEASSKKDLKNACTKARSLEDEIHKLLTS